MQQLTLPFRADERFLRNYLERVMRRTVSLVITDNSTSVISVKAEGKSFKIRLHWIFLSAGHDVLDELADFIRNRKSRTPKISSYIDQNTHFLKKIPPRKVRIRTEGKYHDLLAIFHALNREYFDGRVATSLTWGTKGRRRFVRERTLGSYSRHNNMIRINPVLDTRSVPRYFVAYVMYHEMLHADMGIDTDSERYSLHSRQFKKRERLFRHYERALAWEKKKW
jgi:predicted metal-dependent hydrolase